MNRRLKIIAIVPARGGSKGIPKKNIKKLNKIPLIIYILKTLSKIKLIDRIIVSTDFLDLEKIVKNKFKKKIEIHRRPANLCGDKVPLTSVVKYTAKYLYNKENYKPDIVLQVAPTCPFIKKNTILKMLNLLKKNKTNCCVTLKRIEHEHPYRAKKLNKNNLIFKKFLKNINVEKFISRQDLPELYCTSGGIYARTFSLLKTFNGKNFCLGNKPLGVVVDEIESINIDRIIDFEFAAFVSKKYKL